MGILRFTITAPPVESGLRDAENFSFLGFHKDISVYIEHTSGLAVRISGTIPTVGKADLKLQKASVKE